jgi:hypothetical protein
MTTKEKLLSDAPKTYEDLQEWAAKYGLKIPLKSPFTPDDVNAVMPLLRLPLDEDAIQVSKSSETRKGYDTTGYSYQASVDRLNWVFGPTNWTWRLINEQYELSSTRNGYEKHIHSAEIELSVGYREFNQESKSYEWIAVYSVPPVPTDHESVEKGSSKKGMLTKGIKRAASFLGVGADAYLGTLDDDMVTGINPDDDMRTKKKAEKAIDSKGYFQLIELGKKKGFVSEIKLREWYKVESQGAITGDPASLTKAEAYEVKGWLFKLPDPADDDFDEPVTNPTQEPDRIEDEKEEPTVSGYPKSLDELMGTDEAIIRSIATDFSFVMPSQLTDRNKGPLCKTLWNLMKAK